MRILHVEDNPSDADLARRYLSLYAPQFTLETVATQDEAMARITRQRAPLYDLVLTDLHLPTGDGLSLLNSIRERALPLAVVVITGAGSEETAIAALKAGADDYLVKRNDYLERLPLTLESALHHYRAEAARQARPLKVLYAERNTVDSDLTRRHFARYAPHIHLDMVTTGPQALERLPQAGEAPLYDLILLDYRLPGLSALEVLKELRQNYHLDMPVVLVTGQGDEEVALQALKLGATSYVVKNPGYLYQLPNELENAYYRAELVREQIALRQSEERFVKAFHSNPQPMSLTTLEEGRYVDVNEYWVKMSGYTRKEIIGHTSIELNVWGSPEVRAEFVRQLEEQGAIRNLEKRFFTKSGEIRVLLSSAELIELGGVRCILMASSDITERKQAEENLVFLAELNAAFATLATPEEIMRLAGEKIYRHFSASRVNFSDVNEAANEVTVFSSKRDLDLKEDHITHRLAEYLSDELISGLKAGRVMAVNDVRRDPHTASQAAAYEQWEIGSLVLVPYLSDEHWKFMLVVHKGEPYAWRVDEIKLLQELTGRVYLRLERARAEASLRESEERFAKAFHSNPQSMIITTLEEGRYVDVNEYFVKMSGYTREELIGHTSIELNFWESLEARAEFVKQLQEQEALRNLEKQFRTKSGEIRVLLSSAELIELGGVRCILRASSDITERKRMEEELRQSLAEVRRLKDQLQAENVYLREEVQLAQDFSQIIGSSGSLKSVLVQVEQVAPTDSTVLITGETGTGKELIAHAIHSLNRRRDRPLVKVNCAALPATLIESELFGHEKGAFTGANIRRVGRFELAQGGTIFLDEVGELPLELQSKLLRVLQDNEFERLGSSRTMKVDVRVLAATNRELEEAVRAGKFRADLYYRLSVFPIHLPPLRERVEDIRPLVNFYVQQFSQKLSKQIMIIPAEALEALERYSWPGNVRELKNVIERAVILSSGGKLQLAESMRVNRAAEVGKVKVNEPKAVKRDRAQGARLDEVEREHILRVMEQTYWRVEGEQGAAKILGVNPGTLRSRLKKLGLRRPPA